MPIKDLYKTLTLVGVLLLIVLIGFIYLFSGIRNRNEKASLILSEIQTELIREAKLKTLKETVLNTADKRDELTGYALGSEATVSLIEEVERMGGIFGAGVSIQNVGIDSFDGDENFEWLTFTVTSVGTWGSTLNLISAIEALPYRTEIDSLVLSQNEEEGSSLWQSKTALKVLKHK